MQKRWAEPSLYLSVLSIYAPEQEQGTVRSPHLCLCSSCLSGSTEGTGVKKTDFRGSGSASNTWLLCIVSSSLQARLHMLFVWQSNESDQQQPFCLPTQVHHIAMPPTLLSQCRWGGTRELQPLMPCWEEQGHGLKAQQGCKEQGGKETEKQMAAWGDDYRENHRVKKEEQSTKGLQRTGREGVEKEKADKRASDYVSFSPRHLEPYLSIKTASEELQNLWHKGSISAFAFPSLPVADFKTASPSAFWYKNTNIAKWALWREIAFVFGFGFVQT